MKPREDFSLIKVILWDIDGTLLNFKMSERYAIEYCFNKFHMGTCTDEMLQRYSVINRGYWERLETGELTREQVMLGRFHEFFESEGLPTDQVKVFNDEYQIRLGGPFLEPGDRLADRSAFPDNLDVRKIVLQHLLKAPSGHHFIFYNKDFHKRGNFTL